MYSMYILSAIRACTKETLLECYSLICEMSKKIVQGPGYSLVPIAVSCDEYWAIDLRREELCHTTVKFFRDIIIS